MANSDFCEGCGCCFKYLDAGFCSQCWNDMEPAVPGFPKLDSRDCGPDEEEEVMCHDCGQWDWARWFQGACAGCGGSNVSAFYGPPAPAEWEVSEDGEWIVPVE